MIPFEALDFGSNVEFCWKVNNGLKLWINEEVNIYFVMVIISQISGRNCCWKMASWRAVLKIIELYWEFFGIESFLLLL